MPGASSPMLKATITAAQFVNMLMPFLNLYEKYSKRYCSFPAPFASSRDEKSLHEHVVIEIDIHKLLCTLCRSSKSFHIN